MDLVIDESVTENTTKLDFSNERTMRYPSESVTEQPDEPRYVFDYSMPRDHVMEQDNMHTPIDMPDRHLYENMEAYRQSNIVENKERTSIQNLPQMDPSHTSNFTLSLLHKVMAKSTSSNFEPSALNVKSKYNFNRLVPPTLAPNMSRKAHAPLSIAPVQQNMFQVNTENTTHIKQEHVNNTDIKQEHFSQESPSCQKHSRNGATGFQTSSQQLQIKTEPMDSSETIPIPPAPRRGNIALPNETQLFPTATKKVVTISKAEEERRIKIERHCLHLEHASYCQETKCVIPLCKKMKKVINHSRVCRKPNKQTSCVICKQYTLLCALHARRCIKDKVCKVSFCQQFRDQRKRQMMKACRGSSVVKQSVTRT